MIETLLIDDEPRGLTSLQKLLELNCPEVRVIASCEDANGAKEKIILLKPRLVFLDIAMPGKNGLDLLYEFEEIDFEIIFVTAHSNYMTQAFHFSAVDYLLKPVDEVLLAAAVDRASKRLDKIMLPDSRRDTEAIEVLKHNVRQRSMYEKMKLCIPSIKGFLVVEIDEIIYCEANGNYTNFYFVNRPTICASKPIHDYEQLLLDCNFVRTHKSFLINLEHIKEYIRGEGGTLVLSNGKEVEVSRRKKEWLMTKIKLFYKY
jgi:two-component system LytT family response regulator